MDELGIPGMPFVPTRLELESLNPFDTSIAENFPGLRVYCFIGRLQACKMILARAEELRKIFVPPFTSRVNLTTCKHISQLAQQVLKQRVTNQLSLSLSLYIYMYINLLSMVQVVDNVKNIEESFHCCLKEILGDEDTNEFFSAKVHTLVNRALLISSEIAGILTEDKMSVS